MRHILSIALIIAAIMGLASLAQDRRHDALIVADIETAAGQPQAAQPAPYTE